MRGRGIVRSKYDLLSNNPPLALREPPLHKGAFGDGFTPATARGVLVR